MRGVILYQSKYGATKTYARWLSEATGFSMIETKNAKIEEITGFDVIILGGGIYASGIAGLGFLRKNIAALKDKKIIVFCCGASPHEEATFEQIVKHNMKGELSTVPCFYCRGAWNPKTMHFIDRNLCRILQKSVAKKKPEELEIWEKALVAAGQESCDWTDKAYLQPILEMLA